MINFLNPIKHLLPRAEAWRITTDKQLRQLFEGLTGSFDDIKSFVEDGYNDRFADTTRNLDDWEWEFALKASTLLSEQERRDRVDTAMRSLGGQSPRYIQDTLRGQGFDVYVHEWWVPGTEDAPVVRPPLTVLRQSEAEHGFRWTCGAPGVTCGNTAITCGATTELLGYPLVNKVVSTGPLYDVTCGKPSATCGSPLSTCGHFEDLLFSRKEYRIPVSPSTWPYFIYIGAETFPGMATIPFSRKDEFEDLCLKICPLQLWIGVLVNFQGD